jgi:hypothetical protein
LAALHDATVGCLDVLLGTDHGEWHSGHEGACVLGSGFIVFLNGWGVDLNTLSFDDGTDLS